MADEAEFVYDPTVFELRRDGEPVMLEPQVLDVMAYLIEHRDRLVTKEELLDEVWGDRFVSESALTTRIKEVRRALGDDGKRQRFVQTVHGRGYRFVGDVAIDEGTRAEAAVAGDLSNLPVPRTELVGRDVDLAHLAELVGSNRLTSVLGVGGTGKTRLAVALGWSVVRDFDDGVWFVDLVPATTADEVEDAIARAAGLGLSAGAPRAQLTALMRDRQMLCILDNCEHILDTVAEVLDNLLDTTVTPKFLVTSREAVGLADECRFALEPLSVGEDGGAALELFAACASRFGVELGGDGLRVAAGICRRLDGLPLAIELAAAQLRLMTIDDLAHRLDQRFELLVGHRPSTRHASLGAVIDETWELLTEPERDLLRQLAAFAATFSLDDIEEVVGAGDTGTARTLSALVDRSLVKRLASGRFRLLETIRLYARNSQDAEGQAARVDRHANWCVARARADLHSHYYDYELARWCELHVDDINAAVSHLLAAGRVEDAGVLVAATGLAMHIDDGSRAAGMLRRVATCLDRVDEPGLRARLHITGALAAMGARAPAELAAHGSAAISEARATDDAWLTSTSLVVGSWSAVLYDGDLALEMVDEASRLASDAGDERAVDLAEAYRAWHLALTRRYDEADCVADSVLGRAPEVLGYPTVCAAVVRAACAALVEPDEAARIVRDWIEKWLLRSMWGNDVMVATIAAAQGDARATAQTVTRVVERLDRAGQHAFPDLLVPLATLAHRLGDDERAAAWVAAVKHADRPTQSMQVTCLYRRLTELVAPAELDEGVEIDLEAVRADSLSWLEGAVCAR